MRRIYLLLLLFGLFCFGGLCDGSGDESESSKGEEEATPSPLREIDREIQREYEAIHKVHMHLDDDHDGTVDKEESAEFIEKELHEDNGSRQSTFHHANMDAQISVKDVWGSWYKSEVYNWTVDEIIDWLCNVVHLPQYTDNFRRNSVKGKDMPRIAINGEAMIQNELGVVDNAHRKKLELRAMDVVLFGPPRVPYNWWKDVILAAVFISCMIFAGMAWRERKISQIKVDELMELMKIAEDELAELQDKMERESKAAAAAEEAATEKAATEIATMEKVATEMVVADMVPLKKKPPPHERHKKRTFSMDELQRRKSSNDMLKDDTISLPDTLEECLVKEQQLQIAKLQADKTMLLDQLQKRGEISSELQQLLMLTYIKEHSHWMNQKSTAEKQLSTAKKECEKIEKRRGTLLGSIRMINSPVLHDADLKINRALVSLKKVMKNLDEYKRRWRAIENLTGLHVVSSSLIKEDMAVNYGSSENMDHETMYTGECFEDDETMSQYSMTSSITQVSGIHHMGSTRSMDHPYQHQELQQLQKMKLKDMKHSASEGKLVSAPSSSLKVSSNYQKIEEDEEEPYIIPPPRDSTTSSTKRRLFKKSKGN